DDEAAIDVDTVARQLVDLREQRMRIDHNAVANDADDARIQDAGGNQPKDELRSRYENRVAGIVAALVARDEVEPRGNQIDDLFLTYVTPLAAEHSEIHISVNVGRVLWSRSPTARAITQCTAISDTILPSNMRQYRWVAAVLPDVDLSKNCNATS